MVSINKIQRREAIIFYLLACLFSWPFFLLRDVYPNTWLASQISNKFITIGYMWGPGLSAIICFLIFKKSHKRTITFKGTSFTKGILFYIIPFVIFKLTTIINPGYGVVPEDYFLIVIPLGFFLILGEELGWRGFLQDTFRGMKPWKKWVTIGILWETWHFTRGLTNSSFVSIVIKKLIFYVAVIALTFVIGKLTEKTKSLLVAIAIHTWFNILFELSSVNTFISFGIILLFWSILIFKWDRK